MDDNPNDPRAGGAAPPPPVINENECRHKREKPNRKSVIPTEIITKLLCQILS